MTAFLSWHPTKRHARDFCKLLMQAGATDAWFSPPGEPENEWMAVITADNTPEELEDMMVTAYDKLKPESNPLGLYVPDIKSQFEGPYDEFPYSGGHCAVDSPKYHADTKTLEHIPCGKRTPYEVKLHEYSEGDDRIYTYADFQLNNWTPMCWSHFMDALEGRENYIRSGVAELKIRLTGNEPNRPE